MACPPRLEPLPCSLSGVGFIANNTAPDATTITLRMGQGDAFPTPTNGKVFYVDVSGCGCCTRLKVVGRVGDVLTIEQGSTCPCIPAGSRIAYAVNSVEHMRLAAMESMPTFVYPLVYDCTTHTVRLDCAGVKAMVDNPCS